MTASPFLTLHELIRKAWQKLNHDNWDYLAAGADLVAIGRMQCVGLAAGGQAGLVRLLEILEQEVRTCLGLLGVTCWSELDGSYLHPAPAVEPPRTLGAFPLLTLEEQSFY